MAELGYEAPPPGASAWERVRQLLDPAIGETLPRLLAIVQRDVDCTHPEIGALQLLPLPAGTVVVALPDGRYCGGQSAGELHCWDPAWRPTLSEVAWMAQECLEDVLQMPWPMCPQHGRLMVVVGDDDHPDWSCSTGHVVGHVGELGAAQSG
jgi:hypothetical protein